MLSAQSKFVVLENNEPVHVRFLACIYGNEALYKVHLFAKWRQLKFRIANAKESKEITESIHHPNFVGSSFQVGY